MGRWKHKHVNSVLDSVWSVQVNKSVYRVFLVFYIMTQAVVSVSVDFQPLI